MITSQPLPSDYAARFRKEGYAVIPDVLEPGHAASLLGKIAGLQETSSGSPAPFRKRHGQTFGIRDLLALVPEVCALAQSREARALVHPLLGSEAFPIRGLFFDKTPGANWKVPWHQDLAVAVAGRPPDADVRFPHFGPWSVKSGISHVEPPSPFLERRLALRFHLDPCGSENGPLKVLPGTHLDGRLGDQKIAHLAESIRPLECCVGAGGVIVMHPLLLHSSSAALHPGHRRVIHIEYAADVLPEGLQWYEKGTSSPCGSAS